MKEKESESKILNMKEFLINKIRNAKTEVEKIEFYQKLIKLEERDNKND